MQMEHPLTLIVFFVALLFFHVSEFTLALAIHGPSKVSSSSFLLSQQYVIAMLCGLLEYGFELFLFPEIKSMVWISYIGLLLIALGELVRKCAILTAEKNFTHDIKIYHRDGHVLVTHGIYRFVRHPSYLGFFMWSVGTQMLLVNPLCTIGYTVVTWNFFSRRIRFEEFTLRQFFGRQYEEYARNVPSGIPFVK